MIIDCAGGTSKCSNSLGEYGDLCYKSVDALNHVVDPFICCSRCARRSRRVGHDDGGVDRRWRLYRGCGCGREFYWPWPGRCAWGIVLGDDLRDEVLELRGVLLGVTGLFVDRLVCLAQPKVLFLGGFGERV